MKRKNGAVRIALSVLILLLVVAVVLPAFAETAQYSEEEIERGIFLGDNFFAAGENVVISHDVKGDLMVFGQNITVKGDVEGDILGAGETLVIEGDCSNLRIAGRFLAVDGSVGKNATVAGQNLDFKNNSVISGDLFAAGQNIWMDGVYESNVFGGAENIVLRGRVAESMRVRVEDLEVAEEASVGRSLHYYAPAEGRIFSDNIGDLNWDFVESSRQPVSVSEKEKTFEGFSLMFAVFCFFGVLAGGLVFTGFFRPAVRANYGIMEKSFGRSLGFGLLFLAGIPVLAVLSMMTFVGIAFGIFMLLAYGALLYAGKVVFTIVFGRFLMKKFNSGLAEEKGYFSGLFIGAVVLSILTFLPYAGPLVSLLRYAAGLGLVVLYLGGILRGKGQGGKEYVPRHYGPEVSADEEVTDIFVEEEAEKSNN